MVDMTANRTPEELIEYIRMIPDSIRDEVAAQLGVAAPVFYAELEWYSDESGRDHLLRAVKAAGEKIVPETVHLIDTNMLTVIASEWGEASMHITFRSWETPTFVAQALRAGGCRPKEVGPLFADCPDRPTGEQFWAAYDAHIASLGWDD